MRFGSLFSGIGGLDLGLERAGMKCAWQVEIDDYCTKVLEKHWPDVPKYKDVKDVGRNLEPVDLIAGGFPCQPHSVAGKRKGAADDRNLWPEFIRIIRETKPRYVLGENVLGIVTTYLDTVLSDLEGEGYTCATFNLPACGFDAPHRRQRIFIVAWNTNGRDRNKGSFKEVAPRKDTKPAGVYTDVADRIGTDGGRGGVAGKSDRQGWRQTQTERESLQPGHREAYTGKSQSGSPDVSNTEGMRGITIKRNEQDRVIPEDESRTWWTVEPEVGRVAHGIPSRVDRLRGLGNAVVPQVAEWIGRRILDYETLREED